VAHRFFDFLVYIFEARAYSGILKQSEKAGTLVWVPNSQLKSLPIEQGDHFIINWIDSGEPINHRITLSDDETFCETLPD